MTANGKQQADPAPSYTVGTYSDADIRPADDTPKLSPVMQSFFELERERTIAKLRDIDRLLGRRQTIPERMR